MIYRLRERWPLYAGVAAALAVLAAYRVGGIGNRDWSILGIDHDGWGLAAIVLAAFLLLQQWLSARISLQRERRLVTTAAALREATARLEQLATTDALTGLFTRRVFDERLGVEAHRAQRYGRPLSLLMIDLDSFKQVNDTHGHPFGDLVLAETAGILRAQLRESDCIARYGGEEFVVLLPETGRGDATAVAEKLCDAVAEREYSKDGVSVHVTISIGVSAVPSPGLTSEEDLLRHADDALYRAKRAGGGRVVATAPVTPSGTLPGPLAGG